MIVHRGSILEVTSGIIVHQVNAQGVMGSGVARVLRDAYPQIWDDYSAHVKDYHNSDIMGDVIYSHVAPNLIIANLVGQYQFGSDGSRYTSYDALDKGFSNIAKFVKDSGQNNDIVNYPMLGAGLGGGNWDIISSIIQTHLGNNTNVWVPA